MFNLDNFSPTKNPDQSPHPVAERANVLADSEVAGLRQKIGIFCYQAGFF